MEFISIQKVLFSQILLNPKRLKGTVGSFCDKKKTLYTYTLFLKFGQGVAS